MSRFQRELGVIPRIAWVIGLIVYFGFGVFAFTFLVPSDNHMRTWDPGLQLLFCFGVPLILLAYVLFAGYVYGDAKRRGMRYVMWTLLAMFIPDGIGVILYFILRAPMPRPCPGCVKDVPAGFVFCPHCGTALQATCPNCGKGVERSWANCPHCGTKLPSPPLQATSDAARFRP